MTSASRSTGRPSVREVLTVLSLVAGCAVVFMDLLAPSSLRPLNLAVGILIALTITGGLAIWWRQRPSPVANQLLGLLLTAVAGFIGLTLALSA